MVNYPFDFCPYCGAELSPIEPPVMQHCDSCERCVFYNPVPVARIAVIDEDRILLVKVDINDSDLWTTPGGMIEPGEDPDVAAARELEEETGLTVDPDDLQLFDARSLVQFENFHKTRIVYAVDRTAIEGPLRIGEEPAAVGFWTASAFEAADQTLSEYNPPDQQDLYWWIRESQETITSKQ